MLYYCTAGRGTEIFVKKELQQTLNILPQQIETTDGKVFFTFNSCNIEILCKLKSVERVFAQILHIKRTETTENLTTYNNVKKAVLTRSEWFDTELLSIIEQLKQGFREIDEKPPPAKKHCGTYQNTSFRISCKCTGTVGRHVQSQNLSRILGVALSKHLKWKIDLKSPSIEVNLHLNDDGLIIGIPLKRYPLSKRSYIKHFGLRATVAWIISDVVNPKCGDKVLDPMCGKATILVELAKTYPAVHCLGIDKDIIQLKVAAENIDFSELTTQIDLVHADSSGMLLNDNSFDHVVCDAPFGKKFEPDEEIKVFYSKLFYQVYKVLCPGGRLVLLTSSDIYRQISQRDKLSNKFSKIEGNQNSESLHCETSENNSHMLCSDSYSKNDDQPSDRNEPKLDFSDKTFSDDPDSKRFENKHLETDYRFSEVRILSCDRIKCELDAGYKTFSDILEHKQSENKLLETDHRSTEISSISEMPHDKCEMEKSETDCRRKSYDNIPSDDISNKCDVHVLDIDSRNATKDESEATINCAGLKLLDYHYIKLGETDSYICVFIK